MHNTLFFPVHNSEINHWWLVHVEITNGVYTEYDPIPRKLDLKIQKAVQRVLEKSRIKINLNKFTNRKIPNCQKDTNSCSILVIATMACLAACEELKYNLIDAVELREEFGRIIRIYPSKQGNLSSSLNIP